MGETEIGITASTREGMLINCACIGERSWEAVHVVRGTILRIGRAREAASDTVAVPCPSPPHRVSNRDVHCARVKREIRPDRHIDNRAGNRWHPVYGWPTVLIDDADGHWARCFCGGALVCLSRDSAFTKNTVANMNAARKISRAVAFDFFIAVGPTSARQRSEFVRALNRG
jgi:hypothetical protein